MSTATEWFRQRKVGKRHQIFTDNIETIKRIRLERLLEGHEACVNCLEWNSRGNLLASGSDDHSVIVWDPFKGIKKTVVKTKHTGNIFSVKFQPHSNDNLIATCASDGRVKLFNLLSNSTILDCESCQIDRVKRLTNHPEEPHLFWSACESGRITQYDIRQRHICEPNTINTLIDLKTTNANLKALCISTNPAKSEMLAVGCNDPHVRLFDRRRIVDSPTLLTPGHLVGFNTHSKSAFNQLFSTTYVTFSADGRELLANMNMEQLYLYDLDNPRSRYKSFEETAAPLVMSMGKLKKTPYASPVKSRLDLLDNLDTGLNLSISEHGKINELLEKNKSSASLYNLRASALIRRNWPSDIYQALRDTCAALNLNPNDIRALVNLIICSSHIGDHTVTSKILDLIEERLGSKAQKEAREALMQHNIIQSFLADYAMSLEENNPNAEFARSHGQTDMVAIQNDDELVDQLDEAGNDVNLDDSYVPDEQLIDAVFSYSISESSDSDESVTTNQNFGKKPSNPVDYDRRFCGHCNLYTDIKEANFFGSHGQFIVAGSDDGAFYIWDKKTTNLVKAVHGDMQILNCLQPHPSLCLLATSGIEPLVKIWSPSGHSNHDVKALEKRCLQNQKFITSDPWETLIRELATSSGDYYHDE